MPQEERRLVTAITLPLFRRYGYGRSGPAGGRGRSGKIAPVRPIFIGGCPRSGTTFLASMLGAHPDYLVIPETGFKATFLGPRRAGLRNRRLGGSGAVCRAPFAFSTGSLSVGSKRNSCGPDGAGVHGVAGAQMGPGDREAVTERLDRPFSGEHARRADALAPFPGRGAGAHRPRRQGRRAHRSVASRAGARTRSSPPRARGSAGWRTGSPRSCPTTCCPLPRVRYEDLVREPGTALKRLCAALELDYTPAMHDGTGFEVSSRLQRDVTPPHRPSATALASGCMAEGAVPA